VSQQRALRRRRGFQKKIADMLTEISLTAVKRNSFGKCLDIARLARDIMQLGCTEIPEAGHHSHPGLLMMRVHFRLPTT
jgi:hypothetical protein